jgi:hypothetical protein
MVAASTSLKTTEPHICELARLVVMVLSGVGKQPVRLAELALWLDESRARTKVAIELANSLAGLLKIKMASHCLAQVERY